MAHYAFLDENNIVVEVITGIDESGPSDTTWEEFYGNFRGKKCKRTSYWTREGVYIDSTTNNPSQDQSKSFRKNFAEIGGIYDEEKNAFIPPKRFNSWVLDEEKCSWKPPIPYPSDGLIYVWNEEIINWTLIEFSV